MDRRFALLLVGALALPAVAFASAVQSEEPAAPAAAAQDDKSADKKAKDPDRMICKNEQVIGSRQTKRVCTTADQARAHRDAGREYTDTGVKKLLEVTGGN